MPPTLDNCIAIEDSIDYDENGNILSYVFYTSWMDYMDAKFRE